MKLRINYIPDGNSCDTKMWFKKWPDSITIHWTGPFPGQTPTDVRDYWCISPGEASAHFIIKDDEVLQCWPINKVAWHCGNKIGNESSIGIEVIPCNKEGQFSEKSITTLKELIATLPVLPVIRHYDWTGKKCPEYYVDRERWQDLVSRIAKKNI